MIQHILVTIDNSNSVFANIAKTDISVIVDGELLHHILIPVGLFYVHIGKLIKIHHVISTNKVRVAVVRMQNTHLINIIARHNGGLNRIKNLATGRDV